MLFLLLVLLTSLTAPVSAQLPYTSEARTAGRQVGATYYVDFENGNDGASGTSSDTAWQHAPGDPQATGVPASVALQPGDTILFRGGVAYRGNITLEADGAEGAPIVYKGDGWGTERALIDGSEVFTGTWTACESLAACDGNPNWENIYYAYLPDSVMPFTANLHQGEEWLWIAQEPDQPDPFFYDEIDNFYDIAYEDITRTSVSDPGRLQGLDPEEFTSAYVLVWRNPNIVVRVRMTGYDSSAGTITFEDIGGDLYDDRDNYYSLYNCGYALDQPGEYYVYDTLEPGQGYKVFLWPLVAGPMDDITFSQREFGFYLSGHDYVTIEGFVIQKHSSEGLHDGVGLKSLSYVTKTHATIRDNVIAHNRHAEGGYGGIYLGGCQNCLVEDNVIEENPLNAGIFLTACDSSSVEGNTIRKAGRTALRFYGTTNSQIVENTVVDNTGTHANGITTYLDCSHIVVDGNLVVNSNIAFTFENASHITLTNNIFHGGGQSRIVAGWGSDFDGVDVYHNNFLQADSDAAFYMGGGANVTIRNNIIDGLLETDPPIDYDLGYNLFTGLAWNQRDLEPTDIHQEDLYAIFVDPDDYDFRLRAGSPAIDAGTNAGVAHDRDGTPRPLGAGWDIGAYEFAPFDIKVYLPLVVKSD